MLKPKTEKPPETAIVVNPEGHGAGASFDWGDQGATGNVD